MLKLTLTTALAVLSLALSLSGAYLAGGIVLANCWTLGLVLDDDTEAEE